jgi:hypothetical protein
MPPVKFVEKTGTRRVKFLTGVFHDGVDYGPDFDTQEADVNPAAAAAYVHQGRAVYIDNEEADDVEKVIGTGSSVRAVVGSGAKAGLDTGNADAAVKTTKGK